MASITVAAHPMSEDEEEYMTDAGAAPGGEEKKEGGEGAAAGGGGADAILQADEEQNVHVAGYGERAIVIEQNAQPIAEPLRRRIKRMRRRCYIGFGVILLPLLLCLISPWYNLDGRKFYIVDGYFGLLIVPSVLIVFALWMRLQNKLTALMRSTFMITIFAFLYILQIGLIPIGPALTKGTSTTRADPDYYVGAIFAIIFTFGVGVGGSILYVAGILEIRELEIRLARLTNVGDIPNAAPVNDDHVFMVPEGGNAVVPHPEGAILSSSENSNVVTINVIDHGTTNIHEKGIKEEAEEQVEQTKYGKEAKEYGDVPLAQAGTGKI